MKKFFIFVINLIKMLLRSLLYLAIAAVLVLGIPRLAFYIYSAPFTYTPQAAPKARVAVVFGAGLQRDGSASLVLRDRVAAAVDLYFTGKVEKLLMSGDNRFINYNEPKAMFDHAVSLGVPEKDIILDYAGRRTYDTCYRARDIFQVNDVILVTQAFHLPRAIFTCNSLGVKAIGVVADRSPYLKSTQVAWEIREIGATLASLWDVWIEKPEPVLGNPEPIFSHKPSGLSQANPSPPFKVEK